MTRALVLLLLCACGAAPGPEPLEASADAGCVKLGARECGAPIAGQPCRVNDLARWVCHPEAAGDVLYRCKLGDDLHTRWTADGECVIE